MNEFRRARWRIIVVLTAIVLSMGVVPQFVQIHPVSAERMTIKSGTNSGSYHVSVPESMPLQLAGTSTATATATATTEPTNTPVPVPTIQAYVPVAGPTTTGSGIVQCPIVNGIASGPVSLTIGSSPTGTSASIPALSCQPVATQIASLFGATANVAVCGKVSAYTPPTSSAAGSLTVNGLLIPIPVGYTPPGYLSVGAIVYEVFLAPGGQLIEISPGFCNVPLAATRVSLGGSYRTGRAYAG